MQRNKHLILRETYRNHFLDIKREYSKSIQETKTNSWKSFCDRNKGNLFGTFFSVLQNKNPASIINTIELPSGVHTSSTNETVEHILNYFFPRTGTIHNGTILPPLTFTTDQIVEEHEIKSAMEKINVKRGTRPVLFYGPVR